jgi:hypothetical protein
MSSGTKNESGDQHWNDIVNIVNRSNSSTTDLQGSVMTHDDAIFDFISSEVDRTQAFADTQVSSGTGRESAKSWRQMISSVFADFGGTQRLAVAGLCALLVVPIVYKAANDNDMPVPAIASSSSDLLINQVATSIGLESHKFINVDVNRLGISEGKQTEVYKAFMTGVVQTDYGVLSTKSDSEAEARKTALLEYHSMNVIQAANTQQEAQAAYDRALSFYTSSDEFSKWLQKGTLVELIYLTASSGLDTGNYSPLISVLEEYGSLTEGVSYEGQSDKYYEEHGMLQEFVASADVSEITDADVKAIRKHARNIKVRIE